MPWPCCGVLSWATCVSSSDMPRSPNFYARRICCCGVLCVWCGVVWCCEKRDNQMTISSERGVIKPKAISQPRPQKAAFWRHGVLLEKATFTSHAHNKAGTKLKPPHNATESPFLFYAANQQLDEKPSSSTTKTSPPHLYYLTLPPTLHPSTLHPQAPSPY